MPQKIYQGEALNGLIQLLRRVQRDDSMSKDDADNLLAGALMLNYSFVKHSEEEEGNTLSTGQIKDILVERVEGILESLDSQMEELHNEE